METNCTSEMTMLVTVSSSIQPVPIHHHLPPPPTLPKPGKDNLRLQRLLKKAAKKNAALALEQTKSFRSSLSPVKEASSDLEHEESLPSAEPPETAAPSSATSISHLSATSISHLSATSISHLSATSISHRVPSPSQRDKPPTLKVTEQRCMAQHFQLTASPPVSLLHRMGVPETPQEPAGMDTALSSLAETSIFVFPQPPPPPPSTPSKERAPGVTYVTKVHTYFHSVKPARARTPIANQPQATSSHEDKRPSPSAGTSSWEFSPGQVLTPLNDIKTPPLEPPPLLSAPKEPKFAPTEESLRPPSPKPSTPPNKSTTNGSDPEPPGSERAPELPKQDNNIPKPPNPSAPWRKKHPGRATPAQADSMQPTSRATKEEGVIQPHLTPNLPNTSPLPIAEPSGKAARGPGGGSAGGWHRLRKHLMVQPEAPNFPTLDELGEEEESKEKASPQASPSQACILFKSKATRMWDAILYQMATNKERKQQAEEKKLQKDANCFLPRRLPILLHKPRFDARKLKELAAKPMTKITTVFEVGRLKPKPREEHSTSFNRTASGWSNN
ncbi:proline-rich protein 33 [Heliangelus exortis]|uniref:proline-rich protein 33 n=1 Tax=Heliangelus exortis TaxID=472823 RepID=UPI003A94FE8F